MYVFVYGTLTDSHRADAVLGSDGYELVARATLEGCHRVEGTYPTLAPGGSVEGRLLAVDDEGLATLDSYEGVDSGLYVRVAIPLARSGRSSERIRVGKATDGAVSDDAWVYVGAPERLDVDERVRWSTGTRFDERVRAGVRDRQAVIRPHE